MAVISFISETENFETLRIVFFKLRNSIELFIKQRIGRHKRMILLPLEENYIGAQINF